MKSLCIVIVLTFISAACYQDKNKKVDVEKLRFSTTDASELFFKNVRKTEYQIEERSEATMEIYRYERPGRERASISPALIINWKNDQAFLILEKGKNLPDEPVFLIRKDHGTDTLQFDGSHHLKHAEMAVNMYNALLDKNEILILHDGTAYPLFTEDEKRAFRRMIFDFLRLVELR